MTHDFIEQKREEIREAKKAYYEAAEVLQHALGTCKCPVDAMACTAVEYRPDGIKQALGVVLGIQDVTRYHQYICTLCGSTYERAAGTKDLILTGYPKVSTEIEV